MKKHLLKGLLAFISMMVFVSYLHAQCPGNKVQMYKPIGRTSCQSKCVPPNKVDHYISQGWSFFCLSGGCCEFADVKRKTKTKS